MPVGGSSSNRVGRTKVQSSELTRTIDSISRLSSYASFISVEARTR
nr:hypothetical protein [Kribbella qitaiheensis]